MEEILDKRKEDREFAALMLLVETIHADLKKLDEKLTEHIRDESVDLAKQISSLVKEGFPDGDPRKHREDHETKLEDASDKKELTKKVREKTVVGLVMSTFALIGVALWEYIKVLVHRA